MAASGGPPLLPLPLRPRALAANEVEEGEVKREKEGALLELGSVCSSCLSTCRPYAKVAAVATATATARRCMLREGAVRKRRRVREPAGKASAIRWPGVVVMCCAGLLLRSAVEQRWMWRRRRLAIGRGVVGAVWCGVVDYYIWCCADCTRTAAMSCERCAVQLWDRAVTHPVANSRAQHVLTHHIYALCAVFDSLPTADTCTSPNTPPPFAAALQELHETQPQSVKGLKCRLQELQQLITASEQRAHAVRNR